jgi:hypothetical protein
LKISGAAIQGLRLKVPANADLHRVNAYAVYAHYLALIVYQATMHIVQYPIPTDPYKIRADIMRKYGKVHLEQILHYIWNLGIPVIPLDDPGVFHGACFRHEGRNVIILKQRTRSASRWAFDVLHELWHSAQEPNDRERSIIEAQEIGKPPSIPDEEKVASQFAGAALLGKNPQQLAEKCLVEANRDLRRFKWAVQKLAKAERLDVDSLANYMAFRLALEGNNWWGTATNLQDFDSDPWTITRNVFFKYTDLSKVNEIDLNLLQKALAPWGEEKNASR